MSLRDRNLILERDRSYSFGHGVGQKLTRLATYLALHEGDAFDRSRRERLSSRLLGELEQAWLDAPDNLAAATDPAYWNIERLLEKTTTWEGERLALRKPKIIINSRVTQPGNLSVSWQPADERDFPRFRDYTPGWGRPVNEIMFVREYETAARLHPHGQYMSDWEAAMCSFLVETCNEAVAEIVGIARRHCEVEVDLQVDLELNEDGYVTGYHHSNAAHREKQRLAPYVEQRNELENLYGISLIEIVSVADAYSRQAVQYPLIARTLQHYFGMKQVGDAKQFRIALKAMRDLLGKLKHDVPTMTLSEEQKSFPRQLTPNSTTRPSDGLMPQPEKEPAAVPAAPMDSSTPVTQETRPGIEQLSYPRHVYQATPEELGPLGVISTMEMIERINEKMRREGRHPISVADFPVNKKLFDRMRIRFEKLGLARQPSTDV